MSNDIVAFVWLLLVPIFPFVSTSKSKLISSLYSSLIVTFPDIVFVPFSSFIIYLISILNVSSLSSCIFITMWFSLLSSYFSIDNISSSTKTSVFTVFPLFAYTFIVNSSSSTYSNSSFKSSIVSSISSFILSFDSFSSSSIKLFTFALFTFSIIKSNVKSSSFNVSNNFIIVFIASFSFIFTK